jgi:hypothetical protein
VCIKRGEPRIAEETGAAAARPRDCRRLLPRPRFACGPRHIKLRLLPTRATIAGRQTWLPHPPPRGRGQLDMRLLCAAQTASCCCLSLALASAVEVLSCCFVLPIPACWAEQVQRYAGIRSCLQLQPCNQSTCLAAPLVVLTPAGPTCAVGRPFHPRSLFLSQAKGLLPRKLLAGCAQQAAGNRLIAEAPGQSTQHHWRAQEVAYWCTCRLAAAAGLTAAERASYTALQRRTVGCEG